MLYYVGNNDKKNVCMCIVQVQSTPPPQVQLFLRQELI